MPEGPPTFLDPNILSSIANMELRAKMLVEGMYAGLHRSPFFGSSVEFADYRAYSQGDELRHIDWRVYGKMDRFYIKRYEVERNLRCYLLLDKSASMGYASEGLSKLEYGSYLAASLAYLVLRQRDSAGLVTFDDRIENNVPARGSLDHIRLLLHILENTTPGAETNIDVVCHEIADTIQRRGIILLISDLFDEPDRILDGLRHFRFKKHDVVVFHLLDPYELSLPHRQLGNFQDLETRQEVAVDPNIFRPEYQKRINAFIDELRLGCWDSQIDYVLVDTSRPVEEALLSYLAKRQATLPPGAH